LYPDCANDVRVNNKVNKEIHFFISSEISPF
jgi:hypothetical protein